MATGLIASTVKSMAQAKGIKLEDRAAELLAQLCGHNLNKAESLIDLLTRFMDGLTDRIITEKHASALVSAAADGTPQGKQRAIAGLFGSLSAGTQIPPEKLRLAMELCSALTNRSGSSTPSTPLAAGLTPLTSEVGKLACDVENTLRDVQIIVQSMAEQDRIKQVPAASVDLWIYAIRICNADGLISEQEASRVCDLFANLLPQLQLSRDDLQRVAGLIRETIR